MHTIIGQCLDMRPGPASEVDLNQFTIMEHKTITKFKTAVHSFYLPVACAMYLVSDKVQVLCSGRLYTLKKPAHSTVYHLSQQSSCIKTAQSSVR